MNGDKPIANTTLVDPTVRNKTAIKMKSRSISNNNSNKDRRISNKDRCSSIKTDSNVVTTNMNNIPIDKNVITRNKNNTKNDNTTTEISPILLESPSSSNHRVTFDFSPKIKEIPTNCKIKRKEGMIIKKKEDMIIKDKTIVVNKAMINSVKSNAKKYTALIPCSNTVVLKYKTEEDLQFDFKNIIKNINTNKKIGNKTSINSSKKDINSSKKEDKIGNSNKKDINNKDNNKKYINNKKDIMKNNIDVENKIIVYNLSYKETEESVSEFFRSFGNVQKTVLEKNSKGFCTGKGVVTFTTPFKDESVLRLNGRLLRIEKMKKQKINKTRLFISHMKKNMKIAELRQILKSKGFVPKSIKIDLNEGRNRGYGFIEFNSGEEAERMIKEYGKIREEVGEKSEVEYSKEKY